LLQPVRLLGMHVRTRKLVGAVVLLLFLVIYAVAVASIGAGHITEASPLLQLLYFVVAGLAWVLPAGLLLRWMARP
jgi:hypothetical protein